MIALSDMLQCPQARKEFGLKPQAWTLMCLLIARPFVSHEVAANALWPLAEPPDQWRKYVNTRISKIRNNRYQPIPILSSHDEGHWMLKNDRKVLAEMIAKMKETADADC